jgi:flagellar motor switch protein FliM
MMKTKTKKVLNQREIDAILGKARAEVKDGDGPDRRSVEPCNFHNTGQMSDQYARFVTGLFEVFARSASNSLGAFLRSHFEMVLASVELVPVRDFLAGFQELGFTAFLPLDPMGATVVLQVDAALVFPVIDLLLGGFGKPGASARELTEIDQEIMEGVAHILGRQLETTWQPMGVRIRSDRQPKPVQVQSVYSSTEKLTVLTFEVKLNDTAGAIVLSFPASLASAMLRDLSSGPSAKSRSDSPAPTSLRARILECQFDSTAGIANLRVPLRELLALQPGSILNLRHPVTASAAFILGGQECFEAVPVRSGKNRAAQLLRASGPMAASNDGP